MTFKIGPTTRNYQKYQAVGAPRNSETRWEPAVLIQTFYKHFKQIMDT